MRLSRWGQVVRAPGAGLDRDTRDQDARGGETWWDGGGRIHEVFDLCRQDVWWRDTGYCDGPAGTVATALAVSVAAVAALRHLEAEDGPEADLWGGHHRRADPVNWTAAD
jgi:hypothetical protein